MSVCAILAIFAILAVAIVVAILLLRHVDAVDYDAHVRQLLLLVETINKIEA